MKMLVGLDGSERQRGVLSAAVSLARRSTAKIVLFRCVGIPRHVPEAAYALSPDEVASLVEKRARDELVAFEQEIPAEHRGGVRVTAGPTVPSIEAAAKEEDADLIVIGSHGYGGFDRVLGTTAASIVNHADRSVLVVRAPERLTAL